MGRVRPRDAPLQQESLSERRALSPVASETGARWTDWSSLAKVLFLAQPPLAYAASPARGQAERGAAFPRSQLLGIGRARPADDGRGGGWKPSQDSQKRGPRSGATDRFRSTRPNVDRHARAGRVLAVKGAANELPDEHQQVHGLQLPCLGSVSSELPSTIQIGKRESVSSFGPAGLRRRPSRRYT